MPTPSSPDSDLPGATQSHAGNDGAADAVLGPAPPADEPSVDARAQPHGHLPITRAIRDQIEQVVWVPGFLSKGNQPIVEMSLLQQAYPNAQVRTFYWDAFSFAEVVQSMNWRCWREALRNSEEAAEKLATELAGDPRVARTVLCGYSLGGGVVRYTITHLAGRGLKINHALLCGAAVNADDDLWLPAIAGTQHGIINIYNRDDGILKRAYRASERHHPAGLQGVHPPPPGLTNLRCELRNWLFHVDKVMQSAILLPSPRAFSSPRQFALTLAARLVMKLAISELRQAFTHQGRAYVRGYLKALDA